MNALLYASTHAAELAGLHLLAPYPGTGDIVAEIRAAGGPQAWYATPAAQQGDDELANMRVVVDHQHTRPAGLSHTAIIDTPHPPPHPLTVQGECSWPNLDPG